MARYSIYYETPSEVTAKTYIQVLMPASREMTLVGINVSPQWTADVQNAGTWVVDRISAIHASGGAYTPIELDPNAQGASSITSTTQVTNPTGSPTVVDSAVIGLHEGWNDLRALGIRSGPAQGFALRRATAASGALVTGLTLIWEE